MVKFRNAQSYYGNTAEARKRQRANLIPGNSWQKRRTQIFRADCFWEYGDKKDKQMIYESLENERDSKNVNKKELKDEKYIDTWWDNFDLEHKKFICKEVISWQTPEFRSKHFKNIEKCLKKKLALFEKG